MANIPLQSITFPGLPDKYTAPTVDATLTQTGAAADAKKTGDEIGAIKNDLLDGTFTVNNAENAQQLTATVGIEDNAPYLFRTSGGSVDIGDREDIKKIVGGTIVNNQLVSVLSDTTYTENGLTWTVVQNSITINGTTTGRSLIVFKAWVSFKVPANHKLLLIPMPTDANGKVVSEFALHKGSGGDATMLLDVHLTTPTIRNINDNISSFYLAGRVNDADVTLNNFKTISPMVVDLTQDFGTAIADYAYNLETATAGAGVAWLKKHFPAQFNAGYQPYDAGSLQSISGLTAHKMVGFNAYDNTTGKAKVVGGNQYQITGTFTALSLDGKTITPDANGYFTPSANGEITVTGGNGTDTCIHLVWDGERDGEYEPYVEYTYPLDDSLTLRGIPKLDANNNLYYDGDVYEADGTVTRRYGIVDLGTLTWTAGSHATFGNYFYASKSGIKYNGNFMQVAFNALCPKYVIVRRHADAFTDKTLTFDGNAGAGTVTQIQIKDSGYSDAATFKTAMSGVYLVYELATPTTEEADPYQETQIVDDFGTEEFVLADGAFPVPVGHNTMYQNNLRAKLEMSPDSPDGDGLYVVQQESGENTYVPLASTATIQNILTRLTALENA